MLSSSSTPKGACHPHGPSRALAALVLLLATALLHGAHLARPFGIEEHNGSYHGSFHKVYERFGFAEVRGVPLSVPRLASLEHATTYLSHPPGFTWIAGALGTAEWQLRLPSVLGAWLAALCLCELLRRSFGAWSALGAGLVLLFSPMISFFDLVTYESLVLPAGLALLLGVSRAREAEGAGRARWTACVALVSLLGPWLDWVYLFYCAALVPLAWGRPRREALRMLALPWALSAASVAGVLLWRGWALAAPALPPTASSFGLDALLDLTVRDRPSLADFTAFSIWRLERSYTIPLLLAALAGLWPFLRRAPRLLLALALPGLLNPLLFANRAVLHEIFFAYLAPVLAGAALALALALPRPRPRRLANLPTLLVALAAAAFPLTGTLQAFERARTPFFRDLGQELDRASEADGAPYVVVFNIPYHYRYYVTSPRVVLQHVRDLPTLLRTIKRTAEQLGVRYLWLRYGAPRDELPPVWSTDPELDKLFAMLPRTRVPALEQALPALEGELALTVREAWLVTLRPPR